MLPHHHLHLHTKTLIFLLNHHPSQPPLAAIAPPPSNSPRWRITVHVDLHHPPLCVVAMNHAHVGTAKNAATTVSFQQRTRFVPAPRDRIDLLSHCSVPKQPSRHWWPETEQQHTSSHSSLTPPRSREREQTTTAATRESSLSRAPE